jgi:hypothetical protein
LTHLQGRTQIATIKSACKSIKIFTTFFTTRWFREKVSANNNKNETIKMPKEKL